MFKALRRVFHRHNWRVTKKESAFYKGTSERIYVELHKCENCNTVRAGIRDIYGFTVYDYDYILGLLVENGVRV